MGEERFGEEDPIFSQVSLGMKNQNDNACDELTHLSLGHPHSSMSIIDKPNHENLPSYPPIIRIHI